MARSSLAARKKLVENTLADIAHSVSGMERATLAKLGPVLAAAQGEVEKDLRTFLAKNKVGTFTAQRLRNALVGVRKGLETVQQLDPTLVQGLRIGSRTAGKLATKNMERALATFAHQFDGTVQPVAIDAGAILARGNKLLFPRFASSAKRYAGKVGDDIRHELAVSRVRGETMEEATVRLQKRIPHVFGNARARAAVVARTEIMNAYNVFHREAFNAARKQDPELVLRWDATLDRRGCFLCREKHGKIVKNEQPPLHPCCRCVLVPWHREWEHESPSGPRPDSEPQPINT